MAVLSKFAVLSTLLAAALAAPLQDSDTNLVPEPRFQLPQSGEHTTHTPLTATSTEDDEAQLLPTPTPALANRQAVSYVESIPVFDSSSGAATTGVPLRVDGDMVERAPDYHTLTFSGREVVIPLMVPITTSVSSSASASTASPVPAPEADGVHARQLIPPSKNPLLNEEKIPDDSAAYIAPGTSGLRIDPPGPFPKNSTVTFANSSLAHPAPGTSGHHVDRPSPFANNNRTAINGSFAYIAPGTSGLRFKHPIAPMRRYLLNEALNKFQVQDAASPAVESESSPNSNPSSSSTSAAAEVTEPSKTLAARQAHMSNTHVAPPNTGCTPTVIVEEDGLHSGEFVQCLKSE